MLGFPEIVDAKFWETHTHPSPPEPDGALLCPFCGSSGSVAGGIDTDKIGKHLYVRVNFECMSGCGWHIQITPNEHDEATVQTVVDHVDLQYFEDMVETMGSPVVNEDYFETFSEIREKHPEVDEKRMQGLGQVYSAWAVDVTESLFHTCEDCKDHITAS
jgi:hypothetical protein